MRGLNTHTHGTTTVTLAAHARRGLQAMDTPETHPLQQTPEAGRSGIQVLLQDPTPTPKHSGENLLSRVLTADNVCAQASALKYGGYQIGYFIWGKAA